MYDSIRDVVWAIVIKLRASEFFDERDVYYGDERNIPRTPTATVGGVRKRRELVATGHQTLNTFEVVVTIFHAKYASQQVNREECDAFAEGIEAFLHDDRRLDGNLVHSFVEQIEPGYMTRDNELMAATRLTWAGFSQSRLTGL